MYPTPYYPQYPQPMVQVNTPAAPNWAQVQLPEVSSMDEVNSYVVNVGQSIVLRSSDHKYLFLKSCTAPGQVTVETFEFKEPPPPPPSPEMMALNQRLAAIEQMLAQAAGKAGADHV